MAAGNGTSRSSSFHPEHLVARRNFSEASTYPCAACERVVTGTGYRCDECSFNIHEACLSLPDRATFDDRHPGGHELTLSRLGASRCCDVCKETSQEGRYMYRCSPCNFDVHPRCTSFVARPPPQPQPQPDGERRGGGVAVGVAVIKIGLLGFRVVDLFTGGLMSPVIDAIEAAIGD